MYIYNDSSMEFLLILALYQVIPVYHVPYALALCMYAVYPLRQTPLLYVHVKCHCKCRGHIYGAPPVAE